MPRFGRAVDDSFGVVDSDFRSINEIENRRRTDLASRTPLASGRQRGDRESRG